MSVLRYGLKDGELVFVDDVPNGLKCGCVCPKCKERLEAHQGQKNEHHFKHYNAEECEHAAETALHMLAKNIVAETKTLFVPNAPQNIYDFSPPGKRYIFDNAILEKELSDGIRADVLLELKGRTLNVEIKVTHEVGEDKRIKLFNNRIPTIEVDLSDMVDNYDEPKIKKVLCSGERTKLLYSPRSHDIYAKWLLGDWKEIFRDRGRNEYVKNCPFSHKYAYIDIWRETYHDHGPDECHECYGAEEFNEETGIYLCRGRYRKLNYAQIERIENIIRLNSTVEYACIVVNGEKKEYGKNPYNQSMQ